MGERLTIDRQNGGRNAEKPITQNVAMLLLIQFQEVMINDIPFQHKRLWNARTYIQDGKCRSKKRNQ